MKQRTVCALMLLVFTAVGCSGVYIGPIPTAKLETVVVTAPPLPTPQATSTPAPTPVPPTAVPTLGPAEFTVTNPAGANCRSGPGTGYRILGRIAQGTTIQVSGVVPPGMEVWYLVNATFANCWVWYDLGNLSGNPNITVAEVPQLPFHDWERNKGEVFVEVKNQTGNNICHLNIVPLNGSDWNRGVDRDFPRRTFMSGDEKEFFVPTGKYRIEATTCGGRNLPAFKLNINWHNNEIVLGNDP